MIAGYGHGGSIPGAQSFMAVQPDSGDTLVILVNDAAIDMDSLTTRVIDAAR